MTKEKRNTGIWNRFRRVFAYIIGIIFFMSGVYKLLDPVGAGLVVESYYDFLHIGLLDFSAKTVGFLLAFTEALVGCALMTGVWRKPVAIIASSFILFFTIISAILLIFNPQMDCGCFGQVISLTHKQTFFKNIFLCVAAAIAFLPFMRLGVPKARKYVSFAVVSASVAVFAVYSLLYIPMKDYTDFKVGTILAAAMEETDDFESVFVYEKDGQTQEFTLDALPDSTWTFVDTEVRKVASSTTPSAVLSFYDLEGVYRDSLLVDGRTFVVSVYDTDAVGRRRWGIIASFVRRAEDYGYNSIVIVSGTQSSLEKSLEKTAIETRAGLDGRIYLSDYKTLVSLNRSNGGTTLFADGILLRKWAFRALPDDDVLQEYTEEDLTDLLMSSSSRGRLLFQGFLLYAFAILMLL